MRVAGTSDGSAKFESKTRFSLRACRIAEPSSKPATAIYGIFSGEHGIAIVPAMLRERQSACLKGQPAWQFSLSLLYSLHLPPNVETPASRSSSSPVAQRTIATPTASRRSGSASAASARARRQILRRPALLQQHHRPRQIPQPRIVRRRVPLVKHHMPLPRLERRQRRPVGTTKVS